MKKPIIEAIKQFVIRHYVLLLIILVPVGAVIFLGSLIAYNESRFFCYTCHMNNDYYHYINKDRPVHTDADKRVFGCISCHKDKAVQHIYKKNIVGLFRKAQLMGNLQARPLKSTKNVYTSDECLSCHTDRLTVKELNPYLLYSPGLQELGLRFDKETHYRYEHFRDNDQQRYNELAVKTTRTEDEQAEFEKLAQIKDGNCAQCHLREKQIADETIIDKQVNFIARNPISCAGCHEEATPDSHPGKPMKSPTRQTCRKCHHGKLHGRFVIFKADCDEQKDTEHCVKCHPLYKSVQTVNR